MKKSSLTCWLFLLASVALADDLGEALLADASEKNAWIYGTAIVLAGIAIGAGLFFGLKARK